MGKAFNSVLGNKKCVFPISNISKRTIQNYISNPQNAIDFIVYNTFEAQNFEIETPDILIFTSPSNVRSYCKKYPIQKHQKVIAMGPSTGRQLRKIGVRNHFIPKIPGELGLIDCIEK